MEWGRVLFWGALVAGGGYLAYRAISSASAAALPGSAAVSTLSFPPAAPAAATVDAVAGQGVNSVSDAGAWAIKLHETGDGQARLTAYPDASGYSIGFGHFGATAGETISADQAEQLFEADLQTAESAIAAHVTVALDQGQYDALADFVFNVGAGAFASSTLLRLLNAGDYAGAAGQFSQWKYSGGQVVAALVQRRADETGEFDG